MVTSQDLRQTTGATIALGIAAIAVTAFIFAGSYPFGIQLSLAFLVSFGICVFHALRVQLHFNLQLLRQHTWLTELTLRNGLNQLSRAEPCHGGIDWDEAQMEAVKDIKSWKSSQDAPVELESRAWVDWVSAAAVVAFHLLFYPLAGWASCRLFGVLLSR